MSEIAVFVIAGYLFFKGGLDLETYIATLGLVGVYLMCLFDWEVKR